jgi:putative transcriptional regulator
MDSPYFKRSVIYLCEHNSDGAMGLIINAPLDINITEMLDNVEAMPIHPQIYKESLNMPVLNGGPVSEDRGFILHEPKDSYQSSIQVSDKISITTSKDILCTLGTEAEPKNYIVALGYSGWTAGQLEQELLDNSWLTVAADPSVIFATPVHERWKKAVQMLGIDVAQLSSDTGHA